MKVHIATKRQTIRNLPEGALKACRQHLETIKSQIRSRVKHPFHIVKNLIRYRKVRYRGLVKNTAQLHTLFALANLTLSERKLAWNAY